MTTSTPFRDLLHAANLRHGTDGFTSPPKEGVLGIFSPFKNPTASAGFEPANLGTKGYRRKCIVLSAGYVLIFKILRSQLCRQNCALSESVHKATCRSTLQIKPMFNKTNNPYSISVQHKLHCSFIKLSYTRTFQL